MTTSRLDRPEERVIASEVQALLSRSPAFRALSASERAAIALDTRKVVAALARPELARAEVAQASEAGVDDPYDPRSLSGAPAARGLESPVPGMPLAGVSTPRAEFKAATTREAIGQMGRIVNELDFPKFVASLITGTFNAVVDASIEQMRAYADLVKSVAMSLNDFRDQNTTADQGRELLAQKYPSTFSLARGDGGLRLSVNDSFDTQMPNFARDLGIDVGDLDDETVEQKLVPAARDEVARGRQQLLATMVLMGINRIVVTDGRINAKVRFNFTATDTMTQHAVDVGYTNVGDTRVTEEYTGEMAAAASTASTATDPATSSAAAYAKGLKRDLVIPNIQVSSQVVTDAAGSLASAGQLMGEVSLNFRSETFPLEKMFDAQQMMHLGDAQNGVARGVASPSAPAAPAPPAASPPAAAAPASPAP